jgi:hypothetical protein
MYWCESAVYIAFQINNASLCICILCLQRFLFIFWAFAHTTTYSLTQRGRHRTQFAYWLNGEYAVSLFSTRGAQLFWLLTLAPILQRHSHLYWSIKSCCAAAGEWCVSVDRLCPCSSNFIHILYICVAGRAKAFRIGSDWIRWRGKGFKIDYGMRDYAKFNCNAGLNLFCWNKRLNKSKALWKFSFDAWDFHLPFTKMSIRKWIMWRRLKY